MTVKWSKNPIYEGKAKILFPVEDHENQIYLEFKNSLTAFNAQKKGEFKGKGHVNREIASYIFRYLKQRGIRSHWIADDGETGMVVDRVTIVPLEVVVRNVLAGSTAKKFGIQEGHSLKAPLVELFFKDDALGDPFVSDEQAEMLEVANKKDLEILKAQALQINAALKEFFLELGLSLIDFKVEFGRLASTGEIVLADEITPDCCRLWDSKTNEKMDKDRFRRDLGGVEEAYQEVLNKIKNVWGAKL